MENLVHLHLRLLLISKVLVLPFFHEYSRYLFWISFITKSTVLRFHMMLNVFLCFCGLHILKYPSFDFLVSVCDWSQCDFSLFSHIGSYSVKSCDSLFGPCSLFTCQNRWHLLSQTFPCYSKSKWTALSVGFALYVLIILNMNLITLYNCLFTTLISQDLRIQVISKFPTHDQGVDP